MAKIVKKVGYFYEVLQICEITGRHFKGHEILPKNTREKELTFSFVFRKALAHSIDFQMSVRPSPLSKISQTNRL